MDESDRSDLGASLRRVEALIAALDRIADPAAREPARELLELVLELHTLGLARIIAIVAAAPGGRVIARPSGRGSAGSGDPAAARAAPAGGRNPHPRGARPAASGLGIARHWRPAPRGREAAARGCFATVGANGPIDTAALRSEIEAAIVEAAPDLDDIVIEGLDEPQFSALAADG